MSSHAGKLSCGIFVLMFPVANRSRLQFLACLACCFDEAVCSHPLCCLLLVVQMSGVFLAQSVSKGAEQPQECKSELVCWLCRKWPVSLPINKATNALSRQINLILPLYQGPGRSKPIEGQQDLQQRSKQSAAAEKKSNGATETWKWVEKEISGNFVVLSCKYNTDSAGNSRPLFISPF